MKGTVRGAQNRWYPRPHRHQKAWIHEETHLWHLPSTAQEKSLIYAQSEFCRTGMGGEDMARNCWWLMRWTGEDQAREEKWKKVLAEDGWEVKGVLKRSRSNLGRRAKWVTRRGRKEATMGEELRGWDSIGGDFLGNGQVQEWGAERGHEEKSLGLSAPTVVHAEGWV